MADAMEIPLPEGLALCWSSKGRGVAATQHFEAGAKVLRSRIVSRGSDLRAVWLQSQGCGASVAARRPSAAWTRISLGP